jgi:uncharacterized Zn finger protein (UPF0148 family)
MSSSTLLFSAPCPSCGAPVPFRSAASVMAVCEYCQTTVLRDADTVKDQGKMSAVLEDFSPLQIGSSGVYEGVGFGVIGRIQLKYSDGMWNEWYVQLEDGQNGWMSDASGQYSITRALGQITAAPPFEQLRINQAYGLAGDDYRVTDVRMAECTGGQGELPFVVGQGWQAHVADLRQGQQFLTLDYSDGFPPQGFLGRAVSLDDLKMQLLRDGDQISRGAGQIRGQMQSLSCPNCGSPVPYVVGVAEHLVCPACRAEVAIEGETATVIATHKQLLKLKTALQLGDQANIDGADYVLIGLAQMEEVDPDESSLWTEYLLYSVKQGFLWLVDEGSNDWQRVTVLNELPEQSGGNVVWQGARWNMEWRYQGRVMYAAGAFNWRIKIGDVQQITDYRRGPNTLTAEQNANEINWSLSEPVTGNTVRQWFGKPPMLDQAPISLGSGDAQTATRIFKWSAVILWVLNLPLVLSGSGSFGLLLISTVILFVLSIVARKGAD